MTGCGAEERRHEGKDNTEDSLTLQVMQPVLTLGLLALFRRGGISDCGGEVWVMNRVSDLVTVGGPIFDRPILAEAADGVGLDIKANGSPWTYS